MPLIDLDGNILFNMQAEKTTSTHIIQSLIDKAGYKEFVTDDKSEQLKVIKYLIGACEVLLYNTIKDNYREATFILQSIFDYNFYITTAFITRKWEDVNNNEIPDDFVKTLISSIEYQQKFKFPISEALTDVNNILAMDKQAIQKSISFISAHLDFEKPFESRFNDSFSKENMENILNISRSLYYLFTIFDTTMTRKEQTLSIHKGIISISGFDGHKPLSLNEYENMMSFSQKLDDDLLKSDREKEMFAIVKRHLGLDKAQIISVANYIESIAETPHLVFEVESLCEHLLQVIPNTATDDLRKFLGYFLFKEEKYKRNSSFGLRKISKNPAIKYTGDLYYTTASLFAVAIIALLSDIANANTSLKDLNEELEKFTHKYKRIEFESQVTCRIKNKYPNARIKNNVTRTKNVQLPREIDVLCVYKNTLVVIECKAFPLKVTRKEVENNIKNITRKVFYKMNQNIKWLRDHVDLITEEFDVDVIKEIKGGLVIKYPNNILEIANTEYPVLHISQLDQIFDSIPDK